MVFRYSLESLLSLRGSLERQEEQRLFAAAAALARLRTQIDELDQRRFDQKRQAFQEISSGAVFQFMASCDSVYEQTKRILSVQLEQAEKQRLAQLERYKHARQNREILEGLRDRQEEAYLMELARRTQQSADEAFLIRTFKYGAD